MSISDICIVFTVHHHTPDCADAQKPSSDALQCSEYLWSFSFWSDAVRRKGGAAKCLVHGWPVGQSCAQRCSFLCSRLKHHVSVPELTLTVGGWGDVWREKSSLPQNTLRTNKAFKGIYFHTGRATHTKKPIF